MSKNPEKRKEQPPPLKKTVLSFTGDHLRRAVEGCVPVAASANERVRVVRLDADESSATFSAQDGWIWARYRIEGKFDPVCCLFTPSALEEIASANKDISAFIFSFGDGWAEVSAGGAKYTIDFSDAFKWTEEPSVREGTWAECDREDFRRAVAMLMPSMGTGMNLKMGVGLGMGMATAKDQLRFLALSAHRISTDRVPAKVEGEGGKWMGTVPREAVRAFDKCFKALDSRLIVRSSGNGFELTSGQYRLTTQLVQGKTKVNAEGKVVQAVPNVKDIMNPVREGATTWKADKAFLLNLIRRGGIFAQVDEKKDKYNRYRFGVGDGRIELSCRDFSGKQSVISEAVKSDGPHCEFIADGDMISEFARSCDPGQAYEFLYEPKRKRLFVLGDTFSQAIALIEES